MIGTHQFALKILTKRFRSFAEMIDCFLLLSSATGGLNNDKYSSFHFVITLYSGIFCIFTT